MQLLAVNKFYVQKLSGSANIFWWAMLMCWQGLNNPCSDIVTTFPLNIPSGLHGQMKLYQHFLCALNLQKSVQTLKTTFQHNRTKKEVRCVFVAVYNNVLTRDKTKFLWLFDVTGEVRVSYSAFCNAAGMRHVLFWETQFSSNSMVFFQQS